MMRGLLLVGVTAAGLAIAGVSWAAGGAKIESRHWSFQGLFGTFDRGALQRGYQVYAEVCAACHSLKYMHYRNLQAIGFTEEQVKKIAADVEVTDGPNDEGEMFERPGRPGDRFKSPFANDKAAAAGNNGVVPPDLTLMTKARLRGPDHTYAILTSYQEAPPPVEKNACRTEVKTKAADGTEKVEFSAPEIADGQYYNAAFPGCVISMAPPLSEDAVEFADGTKATVAQMAADVTTFLSWTAEPELEERKRMGVKVILFLLVLTGLFYALKRKIWSDVH